MARAGEERLQPDQAFTGVEHERVGPLEGRDTDEYGERCQSAVPADGQGDRRRQQQRPEGEDGLLVVSDPQEPQVYAPVGCRGTTLRSPYMSNRSGHSDSVHATDEYAEGDPTTPKVVAGSGRNQKMRHRLTSDARWLSPSNSTVVIAAPETSR